jgi:regulator of cell morphogenesis and NO signaling
MNARLQSSPAEAYILDVHQAIGQIAVQLPGATAIFRRHKLDFCCGGQVSLAQATSEKGLDVRVVMEELLAIARTDAPVEFTSASDLIDHILARYHAVHREQLPELIRMARRVEAVHRDNPLVPKGLAAVLEEAEQDLVSHMMKEENILFPILKNGESPLVSHPVGMMRAEHKQHGAMLEKLMLLSNNANPPQGACNTWRALYAGIAQFHDDLINHIHLENNILFTQFEAQASPPVKSVCCGACG